MKKESSMELSIEQKLKYLSRREAEIAILYESLNELNFENISHISHKLKGNGATFGYPEISSIADKIEIAISKSEYSLIKPLINQIEKIIHTELHKLRP